MPSRDRLAALALGGVGVAVFLLLSARLWPFLIDDAFISMRYALNLASGQGLVYNPGERVEGYTNFLWTVSLAPAFLLRLDPTNWAKTANVLCALGSAWVLYRLGRVTLLTPDAEGGGRAWAALPAAVLLASPLTALSAAEAMETAAFTFLMLLAALWFFEEDGRERLPRSAVALAAMAMTRPEGATAAPWLVVIALSLGRPRAYVMRFALTFIALFGAWWIARALYYGQVFPNTFYAKGDGDVRRGWEDLTQFAAMVGGWSWLAALPALIQRRARAAAIGLAGLVLLRFAFHLWSGGAWMGTHRFLVPALPLLLLLAFGGARALPGGPRVRWPAAAAVAALVLVPGLGAWPIQERAALDYAAGLYRAHLRLALAVRDRTAPDAVIAMDDAGLGPLISQRVSIDMLGLNDAHIAHLPGRFGEKFDVRYVLARRPDLIVLISRVEQPAADSDFPLVGHAALCRDAEFQARYRRLPYEYVFNPGYRLLVYRRTDTTRVPPDF